MGMRARCVSCGSMSSRIISSLVDPSGTPRQSLDPAPKSLGCGISIALRSQSDIVFLPNRLGLNSFSSRPPHPHQKPWAFKAGSILHDFATYIGRGVNSLGKFGRQKREGGRFDFGLGMSEVGMVRVPRGVFVRVIVSLFLLSSQGGLDEHALDKQKDPESGRCSGK